MRHSVYMFKLIRQVSRQHGCSLCNYVGVTIRQVRQLLTGAKLQGRGVYMEKING